ncbi:MAG: hypothetical protein BWY00_01740 [Firmicutes bacterium ADurb.Bin153]|nr:MAG: hypothetical protein BWY00_01740 [Firmicutes bacterium ADurb.Bin153]
MTMPYDSTKPMKKAPKRASLHKIRTAIQSDIARVERWLEVCSEEDRPKAEKNLEALNRVLAGTYDR